MNRLILVILIILNSGLLAFSQNSNWVWARTSTGAVEGSDLATDIFGNAYISGNFFSSSISFGPYALYNPDPGNSNACLAKYDSTGNVLWAKGPVGTSWCQDIATDNLGNVYMSGYFTSASISFGSYTFNKLGTVDAFVVKYNAAGDVIWARSAGGNGGNSSGNSIAIDFAGNVYLSGVFNSSTISFNSVSISNIFGWDIFLCKYDSSGNAIWAKNIIGSLRKTHLATDLSGSVYMTGSFNNSTAVFGSTTLLNSGFDDIFIAKFDSSGNAIWAKSVGGNSSDEGACIITNNLGLVYISGNFNSSSILTESTSITNHGCADIFLAKYDSSGTELWAKSIGSAANDRTSTGGLSTDGLGNIFMSGGFGDFVCGYAEITFDQFTLVTSGFDPMFIVKFDQNGMAVCAASLPAGGNDIEFTNAISADAFGNIYTGADYGIGQFIVGADTLYPGGSESLFIARYSCIDTVLTDTTFESEPDTLIMPNVFTPNHDNLNEIFNPIKIKGFKINQISIFNRWGNLIHTENAPTILWDGTIRNEMASSGVYYWIINYQNSEGKHNKLKGFLHLIR